MIKQLCGRSGNCVKHKKSPVRGQVIFFFIKDRKLIIMHKGMIFKQYFAYNFSDLFFAFGAILHTIHSAINTCDCFIPIVQNNFDNFTFA